MASVHTDVNQIDLFELGTDQHQQEELSEQTVEIVKEKAPAKKRKKGAGRMVLPENLRREIIIIEPTEDVTGCYPITGLNTGNRMLRQPAKSRY